MTAEADSGQSSVEQVRERLVELWSYLTANQTRLINYGSEYREDHRISTARVESTVDQLVDWRMEKKQHMRGIRRGNQQLLKSERPGGPCEGWGGKSGGLATEPPAAILD